MKIQTPTIRDLQRELTRLKSYIEEETALYEEETALYEEETAHLDVTLACDESGYALQIGDNSFTGAAYSFRHWGVGTLWRSSNCTELARELIENCRDLASY
jgi:hypothetical protein